MKVRLVLEVPEEFVDESDSTGLTEAGYNALMGELSWDVVSGPDAVAD